MLLIYVVTSIIILVEYVHVVIVYGCFGVLHSTVTHFNFISAECIVKGVVFWEMGILLLGTRKTAYSCCDIFTLWVKPGNNPLANLFLFSRLLAVGAY